MIPDKRQRQTLYRLVFQTKGLIHVVRGMMRLA